MKKKDEDVLEIYNEWAKGCLFFLSVANFVQLLTPNMERSVFDDHDINIVHLTSTPFHTPCMHIIIVDGGFPGRSGASSKF